MEVVGMELLSPESQSPLSHSFSVGRRWLLVQRCPPKKCPQSFPPLRPTAAASQGGRASFPKLSSAIPKAQKGTCRDAGDWLGPLIEAPSDGDRGAQVPVTAIEGPRHLHETFPNGVPGAFLRAGCQNSHR